MLRRIIYTNPTWSAVTRSPQGRFYTDITKAQLEKKLASGLLLIDVRDPDEIAETGSVGTEKNKSKNLPLTELSSALQLSPDAFKAKYKFEKPSTDAEVAFTCAKGKRSAAASAIAEKAQYKKVLNYAGGAYDWFK